MLHTAYIQLTYSLHMKSDLYSSCICCLWSTYSLHMKIQLHISCIQAIHVLKKKSTDASWFSETIFKSQYFIAYCRTGLGLASQGSKPPKMMGDDSNAATNQDATGINLQYSLTSNNWTFFYGTYRCSVCLKHNVASASKECSSKEKRIYIVCVGG